MQHELTVITTVYNIAEHLPRFFESMDRQTYRDYTLLLFDDGSTDDSLRLCREYSERDDRVKVIAFAHYGISKVRNLAMDYIETPLTAYADGDDYLDPDYLRHLVDAQKKYHSDLVISRVEYHRSEGLVHTSEHPARGEMYIPKSDFDQKLPMLLDDRSLNYLYAKMFRSSILKPLRIDDDVRQGSDTMLVIQYVYHADSIVLIDDMDYHYVRYTNRSVTSYSGEDAFKRFLRINCFVMDYAKEHGFLTKELQHSIDGRIMMTARWVIDRTWYSDIPREQKIARFDFVLQNETYVRAYQRQKGRLKEYSFHPEPPRDGQSYCEYMEKRKKRMDRRARILEKSPSFLVDLYHKIKY